jgi:hypothetical protein
MSSRSTDRGDHDRVDRRRAKSRKTELSAVPTFLDPFSSVFFALYLDLPGGQLAPFLGYMYDLYDVNTIDLCESMPYY